MPESGDVMALPSCATCAHLRPDGHQRDGGRTWGCRDYALCKARGSQPGRKTHGDGEPYAADGAYYERSEATREAWEKAVQR